MSGEDVTLDELSRNIEDARRSADDVEVKHALARAKARLLDQSEPVTLSRYVLLDRIGSGGRGVVYKAYDPALERQVAIKLLRPDVADEEDSVGRARLVREAQAIAQLAHPNVIAVFDVGTFEPGELDEPGAAGADQPGVFVVMEYVHGPTLAGWLRQAKRTWREIQAVFLAAGRGLAAAHQAGLIHRDFKPANVLVGDDGRVRVLDFGLARARGPRLPSESSAASSDASTHRLGEDPDRELSGEPSESGGTKSSRRGIDTPLTRHGIVMGTPSYMAPEQHRGKEVDARTDQFSFCVALYEALAAKRPFPRKAQVRELLAAKERGLEPAPKVPANVPEAIWRVALRGLAPAPADRYPSMEVLLAELGRDPYATRRRLTWAVGVTVVALTAVLGSNAYRERQAAVCGGQAEHLEGVWEDDVRERAGAAFRATGLPYADDTWTFARSQLDGYAQDWVDRRTSSCEATREGGVSQAMAARQELCLDARLAVLGAIADEFVHANEKTVEFAAEIAVQLPPLEACTARSVRAIPTGTLGEDREAAIQIAQMLARASSLYARKDNAGARELARDVLGRAEEVGDAGVQARALILLGRLDRLEGKDAEPTLYRAWKLAEASGDTHTTVEVVIELAHAVMKEPRRIEEAAGLCEVAQARLEADEVEDARLQARLASSLAAIHSEMGRREEGKAEAEEALRIFEEALGSHHPELAHHLIAVAGDRASSGDFAGARKAWEQAGGIVEESLGPSHPLALFVLSGQSGLEWGQSNLDLAVEYGERCVDTAMEAYGRDHVLVAICADRLGQVLTERGDFDRALEMIRLAVEIEENRTPREPRTLTLRLGHLAATLSTAGRLEEALEVIDRVVEMQHEHYPPGHTSRNLGRKKRARILFRLGRAEDAVADYEAVLSELGRERAEADPLFAAGLGSAYASLGRKEEAIESLEAALLRVQSLAATDTRAADVRFALAQTIVEEQPDRARALAEQARETYAGKSTHNRNFREMDAWLREHFPGD